MTAETRLNNSQKQLIADLLVNFAERTVEFVLMRFDEETRMEVRRMMETSPMGNRSTQTQRSLIDFAEFLNYDPQNLSDRGGRHQNLNRNPPKPIQNTGRNSNLSLKSIWALDDESLDALLRTSPPDLTIDALCCSPKYFLQRVLSRLSEAEATHVANEISRVGSIDVERVEEIQIRYCQFASHLLESGTIRSPEIKQP